VASEHIQVDKRIREGFQPHLYKTDDKHCEQLSLREILQARRGGKTPSDDDEGNILDSRKHLQGVSNHGADDDTDLSPTSGELCTLMLLTGI